MTNLVLNILIHLRISIIDSFAYSRCQLTFPYIHLVEKLDPNLKNVSEIELKCKPKFLGPLAGTILPYDNIRHTQVTPTGHFPSNTIGSSLALQANEKVHKA
jgi:hypothetical protein